MNKLTKSLKVPTIITCTIAWAWFLSHDIEDDNKGGTSESSNAIKRMEEIKKNSIVYQVESFHKEYERLKEEERKKLEELERQRLEKLEQERQVKLEQERLARIERERQLAEAKRIEEAKKAEQVRVAQVEVRKKQQQIETGKQQQIISRGSSENANSKSYYDVTFYTAGVESTGKARGDKDYGLTASGTTVYEGRTAACPKSIPFGTKIHIEGFGYRVCEDRGGAIVNGHLDVYVDSLSKARNLGRQKLLVTVLN
ncbi:hypothetical protein FJQ98_15850 [Lysinibacillus agricola]|uniref:3D domain-containing protein n=1 Tax=Lysinibacillus agricola TaxID=2590012 RepID=A0ABX7ALR5_9BACI|nr:MULTISPECIES: 3D domain-containing protein [Lysinibacillus]QQP10720.1 hypothetical protein FJQ98_15850 [Lysinibacillus agricola]